MLEVASCEGGLWEMSRPILFVFCCVWWAGWGASVWGRPGQAPLEWAGGSWEVGWKTAGELGSHLLGRVCANSWAGLPAERVWGLNWEPCWEFTLCYAQDFPWCPQSYSTASTFDHNRQNPRTSDWHSGSLVWCCRCAAYNVGGWCHLQGIRQGATTFVGKHFRLW